jgi:hypothetical protein
MLIRKISHPIKLVMKPELILISLLILVQGCTMNAPIGTNKKDSELYKTWEKKGDTLIFTRYKNGYLYGRNVYINHKLRQGEIYGKSGSMRRIVILEDGTPEFKGGLIIYHQKGRKLYFRNSQFDAEFDVFEIANPEFAKRSASIKILDTLKVTKSKTSSSVDISGILRFKKSTYLQMNYLFRIDKKTQIRVDDYVFIERGRKVDTYNLHGSW